jgi:hypothetical protein
MEGSNKQRVAASFRDNLGVGIAAFHPYVEIAIAKRMIGFLFPSGGTRFSV